MALSLTSQWILLASGLMAHADDVMAGEECERLMTLVDEEVDGDDYAHWLAIVSDPARLADALQGLPLPPADSHPQILESAWLMAVVDGERAQAEVETLGRIAARLGVEHAQLETWREAWTKAQHANAELAAGALAYVLGGGADVPAAHASAVRGFVDELPTTHEHREQLADVGTRGHELTALESGLRAMAVGLRRDLLGRISALDLDDEASERWRAVARAAGLGDDDLGGPSAR
ncbi:hypothetical protein [Paraliomyxa miuraensis]|uniref:hypothetical protein n=1 Tax=Paraliomyxa miuraensis TaxID=376150 RepID=UPI0022565EC8|nr:hypothetical protein [Paraliomyxa miuraensis]MCX4243439.1 hypothetical protein [Paraliomyxa miuraensis]